LAKAGLALRKTAPGEVWFGAPRLSFPGRAMVITGPTLKGSPAYSAGLDRGDRIVSVDGKEIKDQQAWDRILKSYKPGDQSRMLVEGRSGKRNVGVKWQESPNIQIVTFEAIKKPVTPEIKTFRQAWLGSKALHPLPKLP
jgi:predicted metalloprotease with PDZ domain